MNINLFFKFFRIFIRHDYGDLKPIKEGTRYEYAQYFRQIATDPTIWQFLDELIKEGILEECNRNGKAKSIKYRVNKANYKEFLDKWQIYQQFEDIVLENSVAVIK